MNKQVKLHYFANCLGLLLISILLIIVLVDQLLRHDLPCPLCLLQRICFVAIGLAMLMNLRFGIKPSHYALMILATLLGLGVALRQIHLHLAPNDPGYGLRFLGEYLYTWSAIGFFIILILITVALLLDRGFEGSYTLRHKALTLLTALFLFLILAHGISTFIECGPFICPDDPNRYYF
jgi:hypothetical protein